MAQRTASTLNALHKTARLSWEVYRMVSIIGVRSRGIEDAVPKRSVNSLFKVAIMHRALSWVANPCFRSKIPCC